MGSSKLPLLMRWIFGLLLMLACRVDGLSGERKPSNYPPEETSEFGPPSPLNSIVCLPVLMVFNGDVSNVLPSRPDSMPPPPLVASFSALPWDDSLCMLLFLPRFRTGLFLRRLVPLRLSGISLPQPHQFI